MNISVTTNKVLVDTSYITNKNEYNVTKCSFEFSEEYSGLVKQAIFEAGKIAKQVDIINGECDIPYEILTSGYDKVLLRVYAYELNQSDELVLRYSPSPDNFFLNEGSYVLNTDVEPITPSQYEIYTAKLEAGLEQAQNVDIDAEQTSGGASITITNRNAEQKTVEILNGEKGDTGEPGPAGADGKDGEDGKDATINGRNTINIVAGENITIDQSGDSLTINSLGGDGKVRSVNGQTGDVVLDIPEKTSDLTNDSGFINKTVNDLDNYYKKQETYTKTEIDSKISSVYRYKGTVATYSDLPSQDLVVGDVYNVESDGSNYAWTGTTWDKLGGDVDLSNYYTKSQVDTALGTKQNQITNANKLDSSYVDDSLSANKFVTTAEKSVWNAKQDELTAGDNITIANGVISATGSVEIDNATITENANEEIQTVGVIDQKTTNANKFWTGTLAEYNAIATKDNNTFYHITDDETNADFREKVEVITNSDTTYTISNLTANKSYKLGELASLTITECEIFDEESIIYFTSGSTATVLTMPSNVTQLGDTTINANKSYIISVLNRIAIIKEY